MLKKAPFALMLSSGIITGTLLATITNTPSPSPGIEWLAAPRPVKHFSLISTGGSFNKQSLYGRWTLVWFGFLHCADTCPAGLIQMANLADELAASNITTEVTFVFVSVDPGRDSLSDLSRFVRYFNPSFTGITGTEEQLANFAHSLGVRFNVVAAPDNYRVAHSTVFTIMNPAGQLSGRLQPGFDKGTVASQLIQALQAENQNN